MSLYRFAVFAALYLLPLLVSAAGLEPTTNIIGQVTATEVFLSPSVTQIFYDGPTATLEEDIGPSYTTFEASLPSEVVVDYNYSLAYDIPNDENTYIFCWYPISGNYGRSPRFLYYITLAFALLAKDNLWLIAGALAAALLYSGTAAIHACLLVWRGPAGGELDQQALIAILSTACIFAIPLINWSETLRNLGAKVVEEEETEYGDRRSKRMSRNLETEEEGGDGASRAVIIYWAFLVSIGFLCVFVSLFDKNLTFDPYQFSDVDSFSCAPQGNLNYSAGQNPQWELLVVDQEFIDANNCVNPCSKIYENALFRVNNDLQILAMQDVNNAFGTSLSSKKENEQRFSYGYETYGLIMLPYIILQGFSAILFGRRRPLQIRDTIYLYICEHIATPVFLGERRKEWIAKWTAISFYFGTVIVVIIALPLLVVNITATELIVNSFPESESHTHIGAWSPWVATLLALLATLVARYHFSFKKSFIEHEQEEQEDDAKLSGPGSIGSGLIHGLSRAAIALYRTLLHAIDPVSKSIYRVLVTRQKERGVDFGTYVSKEYNNGKAFYDNPRLVAKHSTRHGVVKHPTDHNCFVGHSQNDKDVQFLHDSSLEDLASPYQADQFPESQIRPGMTYNQSYDDGRASSVEGRISTEPYTPIDDNHNRRPRSNATVAHPLSRSRVSETPEMDISSYQHHHQPDSYPLLELPSHTSREYFDTTFIQDTSYHSLSSPVPPEAEPEIPNPSYQPQSHLLSPYNSPPPTSISHLRTSLWSPPPPAPKRVTSVSSPSPSPYSPFQAITSPGLSSPGSTAPILSPQSQSRYPPSPYSPPSQPLPEPPELPKSKRLSRGRQRSQIDYLQVELPPGMERGFDGEEIVLRKGVGGVYKVVKG